MFGHSPANVAATVPEAEVLTLLHVIVKALRPRYVVETGTYHGASAAAIGSALDIGLMDTLEIDQYSVDVATRVLVDLPVTVHHCRSLDFIPRAPVEFAFLDSGIGDMRMQELEHLRPFLAPSALVAMHDAHDLWKPQAGWRFVSLATPQGLVLIQHDS